MAYKRSGTNWFSAAEVAANANVVEFAQSDSVNAYYSIGLAGEKVLIEAVPLTPVYEDPEYPEEATSYNCIYNWEILVAAEGLAVYLWLIDPRQIEEPVSFGPFDVVSPIAVSAVVSPSSVSVVKDGTRQFTVVYYAADGYASVPQLTPVWSVDGGGTIDEGTGLFTAGSTIGGPYIVTATSGVIVDIAEVSIIAVSLADRGGTAIGIGVSLCF